MNGFQTLKAIAAVSALLFGLATVGIANVHEPAEQEAGMTLTGMLSIDGNGGYVLIEEQSGDSVALQGPQGLADHLGSTVKVSGRWVDDPDGTYFLVKRVEAA
jgi:hypothetical protein